MQQILYTITHRDAQHTHLMYARQWQQNNKSLRKQRFEQTAKKKILFKLITTKKSATTTT